MTLNNAVDTLLKREFDVYRSRGLPHPLMTAFGVAAVPYQHPDLDIWRSHFKGVFYLHERINLLVHGAPDDVWESNNSLHVVDYKATSTEKQINLEAPWKQPYKRQAESYQWLLRRNGFAVSDTAYFVFVNADKSKPAFDSRLDFTCQILPYAGRDFWVEQAVLDAHACLTSEKAPERSPDCVWCAYRGACCKTEADVPLLVRRGG